MPAYKPYDAEERARWERNRAVEKKKRDLGRAIRDRMAEMHVTKKELAAAVGCCPNSMTAKIEDPGKFTVEEAARAEVFLGIETVRTAV